MIIEACIVVSVVNDMDEQYEDDDVIEAHLDRVEHIIRNVTNDSEFKIINMKYIGSSVFDIDFEAESEEQVMEFFNSDTKVDTWLEGDVSLNAEFSINLECSDCGPKMIK